METEAKIMCQLEPWSKNISLALVAREEGGRFSCAKEVIMESFPQGSCIVPFITLGPVEAQNLMDDLWRCGYRPSDGTGSAGSLAATERHLDDMRKLVFKVSHEPATVKKFEIDVMNMLRSVNETLASG